MKKQELLINKLENQPTLKDQIKKTLEEAINEKPKEIKGKKIEPPVRIYKTINYREYEIIIRRIGKTYWEYLFIFKGKIFSSYIVVNPLWWLKLYSKWEYKEKELIGIMRMLKSMAEATIDTLLKDDKSKGNNNFKKIYKRKKR